MATLRTTHFTFAFVIAVSYFVAASAQTGRWDMTAGRNCFVHSRFSDVNLTRCEHSMQMAAALREMQTTIRNQGFALAMLKERLDSMEPLVLYELSSMDPSKKLLGVRLNGVSAPVCGPSDFDSDTVLARLVNIKCGGSGGTPSLETPASSPKLWWSLAYCRRFLTSDAALEDYAPCLGQVTTCNGGKGVHDGGCQ